MKKKIGKPKNQSILSFSPVLTLLFPYLSLARYRSKNDNLLSDSSLFINRTLKKKTTSQLPPHLLLSFLPFGWTRSKPIKPDWNISGSVFVILMFVSLPSRHSHQKSAEGPSWLAVLRKWNHTLLFCPVVLSWWWLWCELTPVSEVSWPVPSLVLVQWFWLQMLTKRSVSRGWCFNLLESDWRCPLTFSKLNKRRRRSCFTSRQRRLFCTFCTFCSRMIGRFFQWSVPQSLNPR